MDPRATNLYGVPAQRDHSSGLANHDYCDCAFINSDIHSNISTDYSSSCLPLSLTPCKCPPNNYQLPMTSCDTNSYNSPGTATLRHTDSNTNTYSRPHSATLCDTLFDCVPCNASYIMLICSGMGTANRIVAVWLRRRPQRRRRINK